ncbi:MAG: insulinase family protein, partial [Planctomycetes bacterium]|nr:insulinase family protein [Planctomycetota bacterium]
MRCLAVVLLATAAGCIGAPEPRAPADRAVLGWDPARGVHALHVERPTGTTAAFACFMIGGRLAEEEDEKDAAHLLEHSILFTEKDGVTLSEAFDLAGGLVWGETADTWIAFHGSAPEEKLDALLDLLLAAARDPDLARDSLARTRRVVGIEISRAPVARDEAVRRFHARALSPGGVLLVRVQS